MYIGLLCAEFLASLRRLIAEKLETNPRLSAAVAATGAVVCLMTLWSCVSWIVWPPRRNIYGSVYGTLVSASGAPVPDAMVVFVNDAAGVGSSAKTDSGGRYQASGVQPGRYAVFVQPVVTSSGGQPTKQAATSAKERLTATVPGRYQRPSTSGLVAELKRGRNRYDVDLRSKK